jgi:hypothetical protein
LERLDSLSSPRRLYVDEGNDASLVSQLAIIERNRDPVLNRMSRERARRARLCELWQLP